MTAPFPKIPIFCPDLGILPYYEISNFIEKLSFLGHKFDKMSIFDIFYTITKSVLGSKLTNGPTQVIENQHFLHFTESVFAPYPTHH